MLSPEGPQGHTWHAFISQRALFTRMGWAQFKYSVAGSGLVGVCDLLKVRLDICSMLILRQYQ